LGDRLAPDAFRKKGKSRKLRNNKEPQVAYQERTSSDLILNKFKKAEEDMPAPFRKRGRLRKYPLPVNDSALKAIIKTLLNMQKKVSVRVSRERTVALLLKGAIKALLITQKGASGYVSRERTIALLFKSVY